MTVKYSQDFAQRANLCKSKRCKECGLFLNQLPIFDEQKISNVFWVGLSAVQFQDDEEMQPLSPLTRSGALIHSIEAPYLDKISFYKTNIVKCVPLKEDKIRYPVEHEMEKCFPNFELELSELKPTTVFLLGKQVATFVLKKLSHAIPEFSQDFNYEPIKIGEVNFVPVHHPSFILVYKRKYIDSYIQNIQKLFMKQQSVSKYKHRVVINECEFVCV